MPIVIDASDSDVTIRFSSMQTIVIGDIHGCYAELIELFARVNLVETDLLVSLGDIVDRGADSIKVYDLLKDRPNTIVLMGNH
jgi:serine/threonine protein phosphatase 1